MTEVFGAGLAGAAGAAVRAACAADFGATFAAGFEGLAGLALEDFEVPGLGFFLLAI